MVNRVFIIGATVVVHVHHPGGRVDSLRDLMHVALGRQPRADVQELRDTSLGSQVAHRPAQEPAVLHRHQLGLRRRLAHRQSGRPVNCEVIVTAEPVVIYPGRRGDRGVDP
jgi:hypothetical protein